MRGWIAAFELDWPTNGFLYEERMFSTRESYFWIEQPSTTAVVFAQIYMDGEVLNGVTFETPHLVLGLQGPSMSSQEELQQFLNLVEEKSLVTPPLLVYQAP